MDINQGGSLMQMKKQEQPRKGSWMQTYSGRKFWPIDPRKEDICIEDIAHSLSLLCRFAGHCKSFYSVAQHCCLGVMFGGDMLCTRRNKLNFLLHDASEAYLLDLPTPLKQSGQFGELYKKYEGKLEVEIAMKFNLDWPMLPVVREVDTMMLYTERRDLLSLPPESWLNEVIPFEDSIKLWVPSKAEETFLNLFEALHG